MRRGVAAPMRGRAGKPGGGRADTAVDSYGAMRDRRIVAAVASALESASLLRSEARR
jgi:hypothetical protein